MTRFAALLFALAFATSARAEIISCRARVALNAYYDATFDTATGDVDVSGSGGTTIKGRGSVTVSGVTGHTFVHLATDFSSGAQFEVYDESSRVNLCFAANECYLCTRTN